jgi:hypothetical protein
MKYNISTELNRLLILFVIVSSFIIDSLVFMGMGIVIIFGVSISTIHSGILL